jgi:hypothetical protein
MKKIIGFLITITMIAMLSCEKDTPTPSEIVASQGTYIGVVHLAFTEISGEGTVRYGAHRYNEDNATWEGIGDSEANNWDDDGYLLKDNKIVPGTIYRYKVKAHDDNGESGLSAEATGYAFAGEPATITSIHREEDGDDLEITVNWSDPNNLSGLKNLVEAEYRLLRTENGDLSNFKEIDRQGCLSTNIKTDYSYTDWSVEKDIDYTYKVTIRYKYSKTNCHQSYTETNYYDVDGTAVQDTSNNSNNGNPTVDYTIADLGQVVATTSNDVIIKLTEKVIDNTVYLGMVTGSGYGTPSLYKLNGSSWQSVWSNVPNVSIDDVSFAVSGSDSYFASSDDSLCVYHWNGSSWSYNLTPNDLGQNDNPSSVLIESFNNELYMAIEQAPDYDLQVMKLNGSRWDTIGGDSNGKIATGSIFTSSFENLDGTLYLSYMDDGTYYIKHLVGSNWVTDLQWTPSEELSVSQLVKSGSDIYFNTWTSSTSSSCYVYKVTGSNTVESIVPDDAKDSWFVWGTSALAIDSDGKPILSSLTFEKISDTDINFYYHLNVYNGSEWNTISGDFTDGIEPISVSVVANEIYYVYGEKATLNAANNATVLKAKKMTK